MGKDIIIQTKAPDVKPQQCCAPTVARMRQSEFFGMPRLCENSSIINPMTHVRLDKEDILEAGDEFYCEGWYPIAKHRLNGPAGCRFIYRRSITPMLLTDID